LPVQSAALLALLCVSSTSAPAATVVDTCNQHLTTAGVLTADLDCTGTGLPAVSIEGSGTLDLAGFAIIGGAQGVDCNDGCTIYSSGARGVIRDTGTAIFSGGRKVTVKNVTISDCGGNGVYMPQFSFRRTKIVVMDSEITGCAAIGVTASDATIVRSAITGNGEGISLDHSLRLIDSDVSGNVGVGARAGKSPLNLSNERGAKVIVRGSTVTGNGVGLEILGPVSFRDSAIDDNLGAGVIFDVHESRMDCGNTTFDRNGADGLYWQDASFTVSAKFKQCSLSDNVGRGLHVDPAEGFLGSLVVVDTTVSGNGEDGIFSAVQPQPMLLSNSTITANGGHGIANLQWIPAAPCDVRLIAGTSIVGNGTLAGCGTTRPCADVAACADAQLTIATDAACDTSYILDTGVPGTSWGVCAAD
jgi:hypothetical protein